MMMKIIANRFLTEPDSNPLDPFGLGGRDGHTKKSKTTAEELVWQQATLASCHLQTKFIHKKIKIERLCYTFLSDVKVI
jgi:hypothetical protein